MEAEEYENIAALEKSHWYYRGKRRIVRNWIRRFSTHPETPKRLLDCGAGTGYFAASLQDEYEAYVADDHAESLAMLSRIFPSYRILRIGPAGVEAPDSFFNIVTALDVLEHIKDDREAVRGIHRILRPGGLFVATVPASMSLWSDWDEALHHFRRYDRPMLRSLFDNHWTLLHLNYTNTVAFPAVWLLRKTRESGGNRPEDRIPSRPLNRLLEAIFYHTGISRIPFPFGVSLVLVARREN